MQGNRFSVTFHVHGTLAANATGVFQLPCDATLEQVMAVNTTSNANTLLLGTQSPDDADGIMTAKAIGVSSAPVIFDADDFDGSLSGVDGESPPHFAKSTVFEWLLDYDAGGGAGANFTLIFTFTEG